MPAGYDPSDTTECVPGPMRTAADFARLWSNRTADWKGGDLGQATRLSDGRIVWTLGDNVLTNTRAGRLDPSGQWLSGRGGAGFNHNGLAVQQGNCLRFLSASPEWIPTATIGPGAQPAEIYWPISVVELHDHRLFVFLHRLTFPDFRFESTDIAELDPATFTPKALFRTSLGQQWRSAAYGPDGRLYLFGDWVPPGKQAFDGSSIYLARTGDATIADPRQWEFWHGAGGWARGNNAVDATPIIDGGAGWPTGWWDSRSSSWHIAFKAYEALGDHITEVRVPGRTPTGRWSKLGEVKVPRPPGYADDKQGWTYASIVQPNIEVDGGRLVTWSINRQTPPGVDEIRFPYLIGPEFVGWEPGSPPRWGTSAPFSPLYGPVPAAYLPGRVLALEGIDRTAAANRNAQLEGEQGAKIADLVASAMTSPDAQRSALPVVRLSRAAGGRPIDSATYRRLVQAARSGRPLSDIAAELGASPAAAAAASLPADAATERQVLADVAYIVLFDRPPSAQEAAAFAAKLEAGKSLPSVLHELLSSAAYIRSIYPGATAP